jgi:hypothetical protein
MGMTRFPAASHGDAGIHNTGRFQRTDTRAFCSISGAHDRRVAWTRTGSRVGGAACHRLLDDARAMARALAYELARDTYRFGVVERYSPIADTKGGRSGTVSRPAAIRIAEATTSPFALRADRAR